jgi:ketosteroid isomerase-like protein
MPDTAALARAFLATLEARDWDAWEALMREDVVYDLPQTREHVRGRAAYREFNGGIQWSKQHPREVL